VCFLGFLGSLRRGAALRGVGSSSGGGGNAPSYPTRLKNLKRPKNPKILKKINISINPLSDPPSNAWFVPTRSVGDMIVPTPEARKCIESLIPSNK
jgi:hypothetical protein